MADSRKLQRPLLLSLLKGVETPIMSCTVSYSLPSGAWIWLFYPLKAVAALWLREG